MIQLCMRYLRTYESWHSKRDLKKAKSVSFIITKHMMKSTFIYSIWCIDNNMSSDNSIYITSTYSQNIFTGDLIFHTVEKSINKNDNIYVVVSVVFTSDSLEECKEKLNEYQVEYSAKKYNF